MKTATVTWVTYNNYGTLLQAYALQKQIELLGHENVILSDQDILRSTKDSRPKAPRVMAEPAASAGLAGRLERLAEDPGRIYRSILARRDSVRYAMPYEASQLAFEKFRQEDLQIRQNVTRESLPQLNEEYDAFICGSDQVWSVFDYNFDPYYYLDFAKKKKIAYAPSLGTDRISEQMQYRIQNLLSDFSAVSVREEVSARQLTELTGREVQWVADPTLLHDRTFWVDFSVNVSVPKKKYLLCYFLENRKWYFDLARRMARKLGLSLLLIPNKWDYLQYSFVADFPVGPKEFVALIRDAEYVLTDSYHGSIFSMIFEKEFRYLQRFSEGDPNSQNIRIQSLFGYLEIANRIVYVRESLDRNPTEYSKEKMKRIQESSASFLTDALR